MRKTNEFRISIAIEDKKTGGMVLLVTNDHLFKNRVVLDENEATEEDPNTDVLPMGMEGSLTCSKATWLRIKSEAAKQGVSWSQGTTKTKTPNTYWSSKPRVTVIHVDHDGLLDGSDKKLSIVNTPKGNQVRGSIDDRVSRVVVRDRRQAAPIEGL